MPETNTPTQATPFKVALYRKGLTDVKSLRKKICAECGISEATFYRWQRGDDTPPKLAQEKIAEILHLSTFELWPNG